jgi:hypothetical protein
VDMVMIDGRIVLEHGRVLDLDEPGFLAQAQKAGEDLVSRLG